MRYVRFDKMTRHGRAQGTRVVAGRVVKESYGAAKQQHTFTVGCRIPAAELLTNINGKQT